MRQVYNVIGLPMHPPAAVMVLSVDEKARCRTQRVFPMMAGMPEEHTNDYV